jgi:hypothetical protein
MKPLTFANLDEMIDFIMASEALMTTLFDLIDEEFYGDDD